MYILFYISIFIIVAKFVIGILCSYNIIYVTHIIIFALYLYTIEMIKYIIFKLIKKFIISFYYLSLIYIYIFEIF